MLKGYVIAASVIACTYAVSTYFPQSLSSQHRQKPHSMISSTSLDSQIQENEPDKSGKEKPKEIKPKENPIIYLDDLQELERKGIYIVLKQNDQESYISDKVDGLPTHLQVPKCKDNGIESAYHAYESQGCIKPIPREDYDETFEA